MSGIPPLSFTGGASGPAVSDGGNSSANTPNQVDFGPVWVGGSGGGLTGGMAVFGLIGVMILWLITSKKK